ncbi:unnamed protein product [Symbiodinium sp. CCMP2592]|nr:unnamed protein product [Symbiodinium sp. CCMP2592]
MKNASTFKEEYRPGDYVVYRRDTQVGGTKWSSVSRVIGQENAEAVWVVNAGVPVLCSIHALRPAGEEEVLSHCLLNGIPVLPQSLTEGPKGRRGFVEVREDGEIDVSDENEKQTKARTKRKQEKYDKNITSSSSSDSSSSSSDESSPVGEMAEDPISKTGDLACEEPADEAMNAVLREERESMQLMVEALADKLLKDNGFTPSSGRALLRSMKAMWKLEKKADRARPNPRLADHMSFGAYRHGGAFGVTNATTRYPSVAKYLNSYMLARCRESGTAVEKWNSVTILFGNESPTAVHSDNQNSQGTSNYLYCDGNYSGGALWIRDKDAIHNSAKDTACASTWHAEEGSIEGVKTRTRGRLTHFNGKVKHGVFGTKGERTAEEQQVQPDDMMKACERKDHWKVGQNMHFRIHVTPRRHMYEPNPENFPGDLSRIGYTRETYRFFEDGTHDVVNDEWGRIPEASGITDLAWTGFSLFRIRSVSPADLSSFPEIPKENPEFKAFVAERFGPGEEGAGKKPRKLSFSKCDDHVKEGLKQARKEEWNK